MAIKGLSIPVFGKYNYDTATKKVTYTEGMINPHAVSYSINVQSATSSDLYADNRVVEKDKPRFDTGTVKLETDDLGMEISEFLLGLKKETRSYGDDTKQTATVLIFDDDQEAPELGFGIIEEHQNDGEDNYKAVILKRVQFNIPEDAATTRKDSIDWQTKTIEGTITRSEEVTEHAKFPWKEEAIFDTESEALEFLKAMLGVVEKEAA